jgi:hypothetical protein
MILITNQYKLGFLLMFLCFALSSCFKDLPDKVVFYENNFENNTRTNFSIFGSIGNEIDSLKISSFNNSKVLGRFNSNYLLFKMKELPSHNAIKIEFDLYIHDQWNGNFLPPGIIYPDIWQMAIDNNPVILTTFSNGPYDQSYPNQYQPVMINNKPLSNSWGVLPGVCSNAGKANGTSHYKIEYTTSHSGPLQLALNDVPNPINSLCLKSWSIDNLRLTAIMYK